MRKGHHFNLQKQDLKMPEKGNETINLALRDHQRGVEDWDFSDLAAGLHIWAERMIFEFKLETGTPALSIEPLRKAYGQYRCGRNGFGLRNEIAIDIIHVKFRPYWQVIGTLLHELLHSWQEHSGHTPSPKSKNYHNKQVREKARIFGLDVDSKGITRYLPGNTPFLELLKKYSVEVPEIPQPEASVIQKPKSKLKLYQCPCGVKVRVGRSRFNAKCLDCKGLFKRME
jgi:hypothetical protein